MLRRLSLRTFARVAPLLGLGAVLAAAGCTESGAMKAAEGESSEIPALDTASVRVVRPAATAAEALAVAPPRRLSALADSVGKRVTFLGSFQNAFVAAGRDGRLLVDIGRIDTKLGTPRMLRAFREAAGALAPLRVGDRLRLRGPWGASDATVTGYDEWNGRAVATLDVTSAVDSLVRNVDPVVALALRADTAEAAVSDSCALGGASLPARLAARARAVSDSIASVLRSDSSAPAAPQHAAPKVRVTQAPGCFGAGRLVIFANAAATTRQPARETAVLLDSAGEATRLTVSDLRFKTHEIVGTFDADGDDVDDIAALGRAARTGGTVVLRLDPEKRRLTYIMSGFAWETF